MYFFSAKISDLPLQHSFCMTVVLLKRFGTQVPTAHKVREQ